MEALFGSQGKQGSSYGRNQLSMIDQILQQIKGMQSQGQGDITQNQGYQQGQEWLNNLFNDPEFFKNMEAPAQRQFQEQTVPDLANRFASMGSGGSLGSTGFRNQLAREGSNLHTNIAALRGGMQQQGVNQALNYAQQPFNNYAQLSQLGLTPTNNTYQPPSTGFWGSMVPSAITGASQYYMNQPNNSNSGAQSQPYQPKYSETSNIDMGFRSGAPGYGYG